MPISSNSPSSQIIDSLGSRWHIEPEDLSEQVLHCLMPRDCRQYLAISLPALIPEDEAKTILSNFLSERDNNQYREIIQISSSMDEKDSTKKIYKLTMIIVPFELILKMYNQNINKCIFYIGFSENTKSYTFLNNPPHDKDLAKVNRVGKELPYKTNLIGLKLINFR